MRPDDPHDDEGVAPPFGRPDTTEDQRGEAQPADTSAVEEATEESAAVDRPPADA